MPRSKRQPTGKHEVTAKPEAPTTRRCEFEPGTFPAAEFSFDDKWGWVHKHEGTPPHNTDGNVLRVGAQDTQTVPVTKTIGLGGLVQALVPAFVRRKQPLPPLAPPPE